MVWSNIHAAPMRSKWQVRSDFRPSDFRSGLRCSLIGLSPVLPGHRRLLFTYVICDFLDKVASR